MLDNIKRSCYLNDKKEMVLMCAFDSCDISRKFSLNKSWLHTITYRPNRVKSKDKGFISL